MQASKERTHMQLQLAQERKHAYMCKLSLIHGLDQYTCSAQAHSHAHTPRYLHVYRHIHIHTQHANIDLHTCTHSYTHRFMHIYVDKIVAYQQYI